MRHAHGYGNSLQRLHQFEANCGMLYESSCLDAPCEIHIVHHQDCCKSNAFESAQKCHTRRISILRMGRPCHCIWDKLAPVHEFPNLFPILKEGRHSHSPRQASALQNEGRVDPFARSWSSIEPHNFFGHLKLLQGQIIFLRVSSAWRRQCCSIPYSSQLLMTAYLVLLVKACHIT